MTDAKLTYDDRILAVMAMFIYLEKRSQETDSPFVSVRPDEIMPALKKISYNPSPEAVEYLLTEVFECSDEAGDKPFIAEASRCRYELRDLFREDSDRAKFHFIVFMQQYDEFEEIYSLIAELMHEFYDGPNQEDIPPGRLIRVMRAWFVDTPFL